MIIYSVTNGQLEHFYGIVNGVVKLSLLIFSICLLYKGKITGAIFIQLLNLLREYIK